jgi:hypothetical protein
MGVSRAGQSSSGRSKRRVSRAFEMREEGRSPLVRIQSSNSVKHMVLTQCTVYVRSNRLVWLAMSSSFQGKTEDTDPVARLPDST